MEIDFAALSPPERYKMLSGFIIPRPIALVTSCDSGGRANAAPFSFFNVFGEDPAVVALGFQRHPDGRPKDTEHNIAETGEFVVNMVDEDLAEAMNLCAIDFPEDVDETAAAGLSREPSHLVWPDRIAESPVAFECRHLQSLQFKPGRLLVLGEVVWMRVNDAVIDLQNMRVTDAAYHPVGRLYGDLYARQGDRFALRRQTYREWQLQKRRKSSLSSL